MTTTTKHVYQAINDVKRILAKGGGITKDREAVAGGRYAFRGIDDMYNVLCGITAECGLVMIPRVVGSPRVELGLTAKGGAQTHIFLDVEVDFCSEKDGSVHTGRYVGEAIDVSDKACNKAMSAAYKYAHLMVFQIPTHGQSDDDTENDNHGVSFPREAPREAAPVKITHLSPERSAEIAAASLARMPPVGAPPPAVELPKGDLLPPVKAPRAPRAKPEVPAAPPPPPPPEPDAPPFEVAAESANLLVNGLAGLADRIVQANAFGVLYAFAEEADKVQVEPVRTELFAAIKTRAVHLFETADSAASVKEGFKIVTALGQPEELKRAANTAYTRFR